MRKLLFPFLYFLILATVIFAQEQSNITDQNETEEEILDEADDIDELFSQASEDFVLESEIVDHRAKFESSETITAKISFKSTGLIGAGWTSWDIFSNITEDFDGFAGLTSIATVSFDARPVSEFRIYGNIYAAYNPVEEDSLLDDFDEILSSVTLTEGSWDGPLIKELYCDYILDDFLYVRLGKHDIGWGQGRLFNPGDILSDSLDSFNFRFSIPTLAGLNLVVLTNNGTSYKDLVYASKVDLVLGETLISPALRYNWDEGFTGLFSFKQVIFGTDLFIDLRAKFYNSINSLYIVGGFFREWDDIKLYSEYQFSWEDSETYTNDIAVALGLDNPFSAPFDIGAKWQHNFMDGSGTITLGLNQVLWPYVTMKLGLPLVYGSESSSYVSASPRRISFIFALTLSGGFNIK